MPANDRRQFLKTTAAAALGGAAGAPTAILAADQNAAKTTIAAAALPHKTLGATGASVPIIHLGTSQRLDPVYDKVMHRCYREGVTMLDTALSYGWGSSHRAIANFLDQVNDRKALWLTSKSGSNNPSAFSDGIDQALDELQTDYLDLYLMHGVDDLRLLEPDFIAAGAALKKSGKTRFFGFSCHSGNVVELMNKAAELGSGAIDAILFRYNFRRYGDRELNLAIDRCHQAGIGLMAMKTMASVPAEIENVVQFQSESFTLPQAKLKSVWADERITTVVSEMDSVRVARENIAAAKSPTPLAAAEMQQLNRLAALTSSYACNGCSQLCEHAAGGKEPISIADPLRFLSYAECYGKPERAAELYRALPAGTLHPSRTALAKATAACPQKIDIAARLAEARRQLA